jgi:hypothetical protein
MGSMIHPRTARKTIFVKRHAAFTITTGYDPALARNGDILIKTIQQPDGKWVKQLGMLNVSASWDTGHARATVSRKGIVRSVHMDESDLRIVGFDNDLRRHGMIHDQLYVVRFFDMPN